MTSDQQLKLWLEGESVHNDERDECCPDFSCCNKKINTPRHVRQDFVDANEDVRSSMLMEFLSTALGTIGCDVETSENQNER